jgi:uncharacterized protein
VAGASLLALLDDIATVLDDIAAMTKVSAGKTAGVLGDDLALNAQQVHGIRAERELPVVWAVARGSLKNKAILVPAALGISAVAPWAIRPLLMLGGAYLCLEGFEKIAHRLFHSKVEDEKQHAELTEAVADPAVDMAEFERNKIRGAIRTDFVLSAEIVVITLGTVAGAAFGTRVSVLVGIALIMTVGDILADVTVILLNGLVGVLVGALVLGALILSKSAWNRVRAGRRWTRARRDGPGETRLSGTRSQQYPKQTTTNG